MRPSETNVPVDVDLPTEAVARGPYHHGDLANALVRAAVALARHGGPEAVVLREAARRVGVSPAAAYRHLLTQGNLLDAVKREAQEALTEALERGARAAAAGDAVEDALLRVYEVGQAYVRFALDEPGLFRTAFCRVTPSRPAAQDTAGTNNGGDGGDAGPSNADISRFRSFRVLNDSMDGLVHAGLLSPERRSGAEITAWCAVHGLSCLLLDGSLGLGAADAREDGVRLTIRTVLDGLVRNPSEAARA